MPRPRYNKRKPYAEVLVAALLAHVNRDRRKHSPLPPTLSTISVIPEGNSVKVLGTPAELIELIEYYSKDPNFAAKQKSLSAYRQLSPQNQKYDEIRDTISDMGADRLGFTDEPPRKRGDPQRERRFCLFLPHPPSEIEDNLQAIFTNNGEWDRRAKGKERAKTQEEKTLEKLYQVIYEAVQYFPPDLGDFTLHQRENLQKFIPFIHAALENDFPLDPDLKASFYLNLGKFYIAQGETEKAKPLLERCLERKLSPANGNHYLGVLYYNNAEYQKAEYYYQKALKLRSKQPQEASATLHNLGVLYCDWGKYDLAKESIKKAIAKREQDPFSQGSSQQLLGDIYAIQGEFNLAKECYQKVQALMTDSNLKEHFLIASCKRGLGTILAKQGDYLGAKCLYEQAMQMIESIYGNQHYSLALIKSNLATVNLYLNELNRAGTLYTQALKLAKNAYGDRHPLIADIYADLAFLLSQYPPNTPQRLLAPHLLRQAIDIFAEIAPDHPHFSRTVAQLRRLETRDEAIALRASQKSKAAH